jgi:hypothetical protein
VYDEDDKGADPLWITKLRTMKETLSCGYLPVTGTFGGAAQLLIKILAEADFSTDQMMRDAENC